MDNKYYNHFDFYNMKSSDVNGFLLEKFKTYQQTTNYSCGPSSIKMVLNYYGIRISEKKLIRLCNTNAKNGTTLIDMINGIKQVCNYDVISSLDYDMSKLNSFKSFKKFIFEYLIQGYPIIVESADYGGHYAVIIGYDSSVDNPSEDMLIFADPSDCNDGRNDGYDYFPSERFFNMWFDVNYLNENEKNKPFIIIKKK